MPASTGASPGPCWLKVDNNHESCASVSPAEAAQSTGHHTQIHSYMSAHANAHIHNTHMHASTHTHTDTHTDTNTVTHTHAHTHTQLHTTHTHTHALYLKAGL